VLEGFTLDIPADVTTALVGESGSGKSTLLMLSNGLIMPEAGEVRVFGDAVVPQRLVSLRRRTGYAVQGAGLFPHLTAEENITLVARLSGWADPDIEARLALLFGLLSLDQELRDRFPHSLSGGQQQRVSLCRAMMMDPPLLLLDEPFSALDPLTRSAIHQEFLALQSLSARTILLVTHDMQEAIHLGQHIVILQEGEVRQQGSVDEVVNQPADDYVRRLLGESAA
jgi:osmoprotectant transport system ATP-binding protein